MKYLLELAKQNKKKEEANNEIREGIAPEGFRPNGPIERNSRTAFIITICKPFGFGEGTFVSVPCWLPPSLVVSLRRLQTERKKKLAFHELP